MFNPLVVVLAVFVLVMFSVGGIAYAVFHKTLTANRSSKRLESITDRMRVQNERRATMDLNARRKGIQDAMRELEAKQKAKAKQSQPLSVMIAQAGLRWTKKTFVFFSIGCAVAFFVGVMAMSGKTYIALAAAVVGGFGFPRWFLKFRRKRRIAQFTDELPNAVDIIVRGIKSGLPLGDCLRIIASESKEPVRGEFRQIIETQQLGVTVGDACQKLFERMPVQEANFFGIVIQIQQKSGGNLSETLGNLSKVLRDRKKMKAKINAMSQEAKASAGIIGSLPFIVSGLVYLTSPNYIMLLFTTTTGNLLIVGGLMYMSIGILVMRKMINFDF